MNNHAVVLDLWRTQNGKCPAWGHPISRETGWHSHHVPKIFGEHDGAKNRKLRRPECHRRLHGCLGYDNHCISQDAFESLSRVSWKFLNTVLKGAISGNADCLLDPKQGKPPKQLYSFELKGGSLMNFVGLWDDWKDAKGHWLQSLAIVTTDTSELMARMHPRMPVILHSRDYDRGLDREEMDACRSICYGHTRGLGAQSEVRKHSEQRARDDAESGEGR